MIGGRFVWDLFFFNKDFVVSSAIYSRYPVPESDATKASWSGFSSSLGCWL